MNNSQTQTSPRWVWLLNELYAVDETGKLVAGISACPGGGFEVYQTPYGRYLGLENAKAAIERRLFTHSDTRSH